MPDSRDALDLREPGLADVLGDVDALSLWELLRRSGQALDADELAARARMRLAVVQERLDRLGEVGLVERLRATARRPRIRWRVTREAIVVGYRENDPVDEALNDSIGELFGIERREVIRRHLRSPDEGERVDDRWNRAWCGRLSREEIRSLWDLLQRFERLYLASANRAAAELGDDPFCTHHLEFQFGPLAEGVLPLPEILVEPWDAARRPVWRRWLLGTPAPRLTKPLRSLTEREREVAVQLAGRASREAIAETLGLSKRTLIELVRRVESKLGIRGRRELRDLLGPIPDRDEPSAGARAAGRSAKHAAKEAPHETIEVLDLRLPRLAEAIGSPEPLAIWELLRRFARPASIAELVRVSGLPPAAVRSALEALEAPGRGVLVERLKSSRGSGHPRWRSTRETIVVGCRLDDPEDAAALDPIARIHFEESRAAIGRHAKTFRSLAPHEFMVRSMHAGSFTREELHRIREVIEEVERVCRRSGRRHREIEADEGQRCISHVLLHLEPLSPGVLPTPTMQVLGGSLANETANSLPQRFAMLSVRERQVAYGLTEGRTQREIAAAIGISLHTVVTLTRRCYAKLGVRSKAAMIEAMGLATDADRSDGAERRSQPIRSTPPM
jgi:DNA-binding CsgD family transcriptional regulator/DNA-binding MarR family transcriptional regulator